MLLKGIVSQGSQNFPVHRIPYFFRNYSCNNALDNIAEKFKALPISLYLLFSKYLWEDADKLLLNPFYKQNNWRSDCFVSPSKLVGQSQLLQTHFRIFASCLHFEAICHALSEWISSLLEYWLCKMPGDWIVTTSINSFSSSYCSHALVNSALCFNKPQYFPHFYNDTIMTFFFLQK